MCISTTANQAFNGWRNHATWATALHLSDVVESWIQDDIEEWTKEETEEASNLFRELVEEMLEQADNLNPLLTDLLDIESIDWDELGENALESVFA